MVAKKKETGKSGPAVVAAASIISAVTVYADRAMVTRVAHVSLDVGEGSITVTGLPAALDEYSLRVGGLGPARVRIMGIKIGREFPGQPTAADLLKIQQSLEKAEDEKRLLADQRGVLAQRLSDLKALAAAAGPDLARTLARRKVDLAEAEGIVSFLYENQNKANAQLAKLDRTIREKDRDIEKLRFAFEQRRQPRPREEKSVAVGYECSMGGEFDLTLSYIMPHASWEPTYDLRFNGAEGDTEIRYLAAVCQQTGEDWDRVTLKLSTARPQEGAAPPALEPRFVDFFVPRPAAPPAPAMRSAGAEAMKSARKEAMDTFAVEEEADAAPVLAEVAEASVEAAGPAVTYGVAGLPSVPADGQPHVVAVSTHRFRGELTHMVIPQLTQTAYLRAKAKNDSNLLFLPGVANIFRGDEYVGRAALEAVVPGGEFEYYLGVDDRLKVKFDSLRQADDAAGFTGANRKITFKSEAELENLTGGAANVVLRQRIPVALNKDIKIKIADGKPKADEKKDDGLLEWRLAMKAEEKKTVTLTYEVEFPKGREVTGV